MCYRRFKQQTNTPFCSEHSLQGYGSFITLPDLIPYSLHDITIILQSEVTFLCHPTIITKPALFSQPVIISVCIYISLSGFNSITDMISRFWNLSLLTIIFHKLPPPHTYPQGPRDSGGLWSLSSPGRLSADEKDMEFRLSRSPTHILPHTNLQKKTIIPYLTVRAWLLKNSEGEKDIDWGQQQDKKNALECRVCISKAHCVSWVSVAKMNRYRTYTNYRKREFKHNKDVLA